MPTGLQLDPAFLCHTVQSNPLPFTVGDGAAVIEKAREEKREELESKRMALYDRPEKATEEDLRS